MSTPSSGANRIPLGEALGLGLLQGPTELLPISSSGHLALVPWLFGWDYASADGDLRKAFEVGLHGASALGLLVALRGELLPASRDEWPRTAFLAALSVAPAAAAGYFFEQPIERRLGAPPVVALGLLAGGVALAAADRSPQTRRGADAGPRDALWLGVAQACALVPGISRGGATLAAARLLRFARADAHRVSRQLALPVICGAALLKVVRLRERRLPAQARGSFAAGALVSFCSTAASLPLLRRGERDRALAPYAVYRVALASLTLVRWRTKSP